MEIRLLVKGVADTANLHSLLTSQPHLVWRDSDGNERVCQAQLTGPIQRGGLFDSPAEWVVALNIAAVPASVVAGLVTNYLWSLIQRGRGQNSSGTGKATDIIQSQPPFYDVPSAKMVLTVQTKRVEIDPLRVEFQSLEILVVSLLDDKKSP